MSVYAGPAYQTNAGRISIATKGVVQSNLVLNLDASVSSSYSGSGTTWTDLSGNGNNGTLVNSPTFLGDSYGCLGFNGSSTYISFTSNATFSFGTGDFTVEYWVKYNSFPNLTTVLDMRNSGSGIGYSDFTQTIGRYCYYSSQATAFAATTNFSTNTWIHVVAARTSGNVTMYFNAVQNGSPFAQGDYVNNGLILGTNVAKDAGAYINGSIACVRLYKGLGLSQAQLNQNFNAMRGRFGI